MIIRNSGIKLFLFSHSPIIISFSTDFFCSCHNDWALLYFLSINLNLSCNQRPVTSQWLEDWAFSVPSVLFSEDLLQGCSPKHVNLSNYMFKGRRCMKTTICLQPVACCCIVHCCHFSLNNATTVQRSAAFKTSHRSVPTRTSFFLCPLSPTPSPLCSGPLLSSL